MNDRVHGTRPNRSARLAARAGMAALLGASLLGATNAGAVSGSTTTTKGGRATTLGRVQAEGLKVAPKVRLNRALGAASPVKVRATIRLTDLDDPIGITGGVDPENGTADLETNFQGVRTKLRIVADTGYLAVAPEDQPTFLADWFKVDLTSSSAFLPIMGRLVQSRPQLISSVQSWKSVSTDADRAAKLLHYRGTGSVAALALDQVAGFLPDVRVDVWVDDAQFVRRLDWRIFPDKTADAQGVTATMRYEPGTSIAPAKPKGRIADLPTSDADTSAADDASDTTADTTV